jgi:hypothetical protein
MVGKPDPGADQQQSQERDMTCRILVVVAALSICSLAGATTVRADLPLALCPAGKVGCQAFVGILPEGLRFTLPRPDGIRHGYLIGDRTVSMDDFQAWRQMRCLAYVTWAEARNQGFEGMVAIAWAVVNRAVERPTADLCAVIAAPGQFEPMFRQSGRPWLKAARNGAMLPDFAGDTYPDQVAARIAKAIAWHMMSGRLQTDPTDGATHFVAAETQKRLGRSMPAWTDSFQLTLIEGDHWFYRRGPRVELASAN